jgi:hypothetical protein
MTARMPMHAASQADREPETSRPLRRIAMHNSLVLSTGRRVRKRQTNRGSPTAR